ncbi:hypothetical protein [Rhodoplanes sp. SY1]|uniref:hypothetical protein n=1 Tax=Rhodoplanes sp. SY1 TaxID=3166646 RepID=UPI0038B5D4EF
MLAGLVERVTFHNAESGFCVLRLAARGFPAGFARGTHGQRPAEVNEVTMRPLDGYGALAWLRGRDDVIPDRIGLQG